MPQSSSPPASLLIAFLPQIKASVHQHGVLDLACGSGRNGLYLAESNISVIFADNNPVALEKVAASKAFRESGSRLWQVDFEVPGDKPLEGHRFDSILVFNYLNRPMMKEIKSSVIPGGLILYETFTIRQAEIGRPRNPDYLLQPGELESWFCDWELLHYFEGVEEKPKRFYANIVARKPLEA